MLTSSLGQKEFEQLTVEKIADAYPNFEQRQLG